MTEIEKLFENAGIKCLHPSGFCKHIGATCEVCKRHKYPPFTAEKQLKIIEWFISSNRWWLNWLLNIASLDKTHSFSLDEKLAKLVNKLWESFSDQEKEKIRSILK